MKEEPRSEASRWLAQSGEELRDAEKLAADARFYLALFLCQQSAEMALKAFLYFHEEEDLFTHSVAALLKMASSIDEGFKALKAAKRLDDYYVPTRYPNGLPGEIPARYYDDPEEARKALEWTRSIVRLVRERIAPGEAEEGGPAAAP
jgi:HEPN domain-containing protein